MIRHDDTDYLLTQGAEVYDQARMVAVTVDAIVACKLPMGWRVGTIQFNEESTWRLCVYNHLSDYVEDSDHQLVNVDLMVAWLLHHDWSEVEGG